MRYDAAGNVIFDSTLPQTTSGGGTRTFDAENHLTGAATHTGGVTQWQYYAYDGDGRRIVRQVNGATTWQVTGFGGELLAEYAASSVTILPQKEYGYHGGQLLITASSGDENRLRRFVENIYYRTWGYLPTGGKRQVNINALVTALGQNGQAHPTAMLQEAQLAAAFDHANYQGLTRTNEQYVADLYLAYLQRPPESPAVINWWANFLKTNQVTRLQLRQEFANSGEFAWLVNALYGEQTGDYDRVDRFVNQVALAATGAELNVTRRDAERARFDTAEAQGVTAMQEAGKELGRYLLGATPHDANGTTLPYPYRSDLTTPEYVRRLYETFLRRTPDTQAANWQTQADNPNIGRSYVLEQFLGLSAYAERSAALYREIQWLIPDHLGTPRFIVERTGSAAGVKRSDYLPFGESANTLGGRTAGHGYGGESVRQGFTGYEEDAETGLDYAQARYYASGQGRFMSVDPLMASALLINPKTWNRYSYALNNPLRFFDPTGLFSQDPKSPEGIPGKPVPPTAPCGGIDMPGGCLPWIGGWDVTTIARGAEPLATTPAALAGVTLVLPLAGEAGGTAAAGGTATVANPVGLGLAATLVVGVAAVGVKASEPPGTLPTLGCPVGVMGSSCGMAQMGLQMQMAAVNEQAEAQAGVQANAAVDPNRPGDNQPWTHVGWWSTLANYNLMRRMGRVVEEDGGQTFFTLAAPAGRGPAGWGSQAPRGYVYSEFEVPTNSLIQGGEPDWRIAVHPNASRTQQLKVSRQGGQLAPSVRNVSDVLRTKQR